MRVFVTGATGWIGSAAVPELLRAGHQVTGLTTSTSGARKLQALGAAASVGRLSDHALLREEARKSDGVIHLAFVHGLSHLSLATRARLFAGALNGGIVQSFMRILAETETGALAAIGSGLEHSDRPLVVTSGVLFLPPGRISTEMDNHPAAGMNRSMSESAALRFVEHGVRASVVRFAPTVHGDGDNGFIAQIIQAARKKAGSPFIVDGANRWPAVHRQDAAKLFRLALENGRAGAKYHGVAEQGIPFRDIASLISKRLNVQSTSVTPKQAAKHFGLLSAFVGLDNPSSSNWTQEALGWKPMGETLLSDMEAHYFRS